MKILHCAETIKGGVATVLKQIAEAQINSLRNERIVCLVPESQRCELSNLANENVITYNRHGRNIKSFFNYTVAFIRAIFNERPDLIHIHSTFAGVFSRLVLFVLYPFFRPKVVYCPHAFAFLMEGSYLKKKLYILTEKFLLLFTDVVVCVSEFEKIQAINCGLSPKKLIVIHNGVPVKEHDITKIANKKIELLFVGRLDFQKGYDLLIDAAEQIDSEDFHITIVGDSVNQNIIKRELDNISYTGWLNSEQIESYFLKSDVLIIPSRWEGFAMVPLEAMSYSLPIISSDSTSLPEVVKDSINGLLFKNGDAIDLKNKILTLKNLDLVKMGAEGKNIYMKSFTSHSMIEKTESLYCQLESL